MKAACAHLEKRNKYKYTSKVKLIRNIFVYQRPDSLEYTYCTGLCGTHLDWFLFFFYVPASATRG